MTNFKTYMKLICSIFIVIICIAMEVKAEPVTNRIMGSNRYETSIEISKQGWQQSNYIVLATGENFPDSLCAAPLAQKYAAPILLTEKDKLSDNLVNEIKRLGVREAFLIGGQGVISEDIEKALKMMRITVTRIAGQNRYETAVSVAENLDERDEIIVATGQDFPDALSIASIAAKAGIPILLTDKNTLPVELRQYLKGKGINKTYVVGGKGVISDSVVNGLPSPERLSGSNRYETNIAIVNRFSSLLNPDQIFIATGENFPDALSASVLAAKNDAPIILSNITAETVTKNFITARISTEEKLNIIGGEKLISTASLLDMLKKTFKICIDPGHGGYDTGAIGPTGIREKDVTLAVALKLGEILQKQGIEIIYTRTSDKVSWPSDERADLQARCDIADKAKVNFYISVHINSFNETAKGIETYSFSTGDLGERYAKSVQQELINATGAINRGTKTANFYVIKNTEAPSILTELGFISNPTEEKLLASEEYQNTCANAIAKGIVKVLLNSGQ